MKKHKIGHPFRIIIASINGPSYFLNCYINDICQEVAKNHLYNIKNSFELKEKLYSIGLTNDETFASLDVVAMYECIPIKLVYQSIKNRWNQIAQHTNIEQSFFLQMVKFCIEETNYMLYNDQLYKPKTGIAIGCSLSPVIADFVMTDIINQALIELSYDPKLIVKYVDDILLIAPQDELEETLRVFNSINTSISFTIEYETENSIRSRSKNNQK